jgi:glycosyltransferase involved in cell wall biosynthesis
VTLDVRQSSSYVDVVVPTYGVRESLPEAVASALAQDAEGLTVTVLENGPGDPAVQDLLAPFAGDPRLSHVVTGEVLPQHANWTGALNLGRAPYVAMLHDDDRWEDARFLRRRIAVFEEHPDCGFVASGHREIDGAGKSRPDRPFAVGEGVHAPADFVPHLYVSNFVQPPCVVMRRAACEAVGPEFRSHLGTFIDYDLWLRLALRFPVGYLHVRDCAFRVHEGSLTYERPHLGERYLAWIDEMDRLIARDLPGLRVDASLRCRKRAYARVKAALDAIEENDRGRALRHVRAAVRTHPRTLLDPRMAVVAGAVLVGSRAIGPLQGLRHLVFQRELNVHLRGRPL